MTAHIAIEIGEIDLAPVVVREMRRQRKAIEERKAPFEDGDAAAGKVARHCLIERSNERKSFRFQIGAVKHATHERGGSAWRSLAAEQPSQRRDDRNACDGIDEK